SVIFVFFFQAEDGIRDFHVTGVQTCALPISVNNLLDNAVKYSPPGSPVICEAEADGRELTIRVRDRGYGIAAEDRDHVFEKFYRSEERRVGKRVDQSG